LEETFPHMANLPIKDDPIKRKFYDPIEKSEKYLGLIFWLSVVLSFVIPLCNKASYPDLYNILQITFCVAVFLLFALDMFIRLYLKPRADDMRLKDFLSHAFLIPLSHDQTEAYYNNNETAPIRKLAAQLLENSLHSKSTALEMAKRMRFTTLAYVVVFIIIIVNRSTDLEIITIAAQVIFGQHIISTLLRIEWTRNRYERVYEDVYNLFQFNPAKENFEIKTLEALTKYETTKANGGVLLSSKIFDSNNEKVSKDWNNLKSKLNIS
jgi:hypothetical protein